MEKLLKKMFEKYTLPGSNSKAADGTCRAACHAAAVSLD